MRFYRFIVRPPQVLSGWLHYSFGNAAKQGYFLYPSMPRQVEVTSDARDTRHHYLKGLEGCSAGLLARVQGAFEDLYGLLRTLLDHSLRTGQVTALNVMVV